jgi:hypothetical protein
VLEQELARADCTEQGAMSRPQLLQFQETLQQMLRVAQDDTFDTAAHLRPEGMGRIIVDSWPFTSELGALILEALQLFATARKKKGL